MPSALVKIPAPNGNSSLARVAFECVVQQLTWLMIKIGNQGEWFWGKMSNFKCQCQKQEELLSVYPKQIVMGKYSTLTDLFDRA